VSIGANPGTSICAGVNVTFTATPTNGGSTPAYQWKVNGSNVGTGSTYSNSTLENGDIVSVVLTSNASCLSTTTGTDQETITTTQPNLTNINNSLSPGTPIANGDYLWNGNTSADWNTSGNWFELNGTNFISASTAPATATKVFVINYAVAQSCVSSTNSPTIGAAANSNDITIGTGATLTVTGTNSLSVYGNWMSRGTFNPATGEVDFMGSGNKTISSFGNHFYKVYINKTSATDRITMVDAFESNDRLVISNGIFETPSNLIGKAQSVQVETGAELKIYGNGIFKANE
jgi:hypothetical protein